MTNGEWLRDMADKQGVPLVSLWKAQEGLAKAKKTKADVAMARLMLAHGRLTEEARAWVAKEYPQ